MVMEAWRFFRTLLGGKSRKSRRFGYATRGLAEIIMGIKKISGFRGLTSYWKRLW